MKSYIIQVRAEAFKGARLDNLYGPFTSEDFAYRRANDLRVMFQRASMPEAFVTVRELTPLNAHRIVRWTREALAFLRGETSILAPYEQ